MLSQYLFNLGQIVPLYALIGSAFYLASKASQHHAFAVATAFLMAPFVAHNLAAHIPLGLAALTGVVLCALLGFGYQVGTGLLQTRGARSGHLLIGSLAILGIGENLLAVLFGSNSITLWPSSYVDLWLKVPFVVTSQQALGLALAAASLAAIVALLHRSLPGKAFLALQDSPLNLSVCGYNTVLLERAMSSLGFALMGVAGLLWALSLRIKPSMGTEVGVAGAVLMLGGTLFGTGAYGIIAAAIVLSALRLVLSLLFEGDWNLSAMLIFLLFAVALHKTRARTSEWETGWGK